jgi:hypothetical protein
MNLVVGDIFKDVQDTFSDTMDDALEVIKWFNSHSRALGLFNDVQVQNDRYPRALALILPAIT